MTRASCHSGRAIYRPAPLKLVPRPKRPPRPRLVASAPAVGHNDTVKTNPLGIPLAALLAACALLTGCPPVMHRPAPLAADAPPRPQRLNALLINGGGRRETNFQSHLTHVQATSSHCSRTAACRRRNITIFSGDGSDPAADLATRDDRRRAALLAAAAARSRSPLRPPVTLRRLHGRRLLLHPATREALPPGSRTRAAARPRRHAAALRHRPRRAEQAGPHQQHHRAVEARS